MIGGNRKLSRKSTSADRQALETAFQIAMGNQKRQFAILNAVSTAYRSALVNSRDSLRLPPTRCGNAVERGVKP